MGIKSLFKVSLLPLLLLFVIIPAKAQWIRTNGPYYGFVRSFASIGDTIFALAFNAGYLYKSTDHGLTWNRISSADKLEITSMLIRDKIIFVSGFKGISKSTDGGISWTICNTLTGGILAQNNKYIFAGTNEYPGFGIIRSSDDGNTWIGSDSTIATQNTVYSFFADDSVLLVGDGKNGLYRTTDLGHTWSAPDDTTLKSNFIETIKSAGNILFASGYGLFRSVDEGRTWMLNDTNQALDILRYGKYLFAVGFSGIFRSSDEGVHWEPSMDGLHDFDVRTIISLSGDLLVGTYNDWIYRSQDTGKTWIRMNGGLGISPTSLSGSEIEFLPLVGMGSSIFVGTGSGIYRSDDGGNSWIPKNFGMYDGSITGLAIKDNALFACSNPGGTFESTNSGENWAKLPSSGYNVWVFDSSIFLVDNIDSWMVRSIDNGKNSTPCYVDSIIFPYNGYSINALCSVKGELFAGGYHYDVDTTRGIILRSHDGGLYWSRLRSLNIKHAQVLCFISDADTILAGTDNLGLFRSTDLGESWIASNNGLTGLNITSLTIGGKNIFAGTDSGIFFSKDDGQNWKDISQSLRNKDIVSLLSNNGYLYAGIGIGHAYNDSAAIANIGFWKRSLDELAVSEQPPSNPSFKLSVTENPFTNETSLRIIMNNAALLKLEIFDVLGRRLYSDSKFFEQGDGNWIIPSTDLPHEIVYARVTSPNGEAQTVKLIHE